MLFDFEYLPQHDLSHLIERASVGNGVFCLGHFRLGRLRS